MKLTPDERKMLEGGYGAAKARALDYIIQFGEAFDAERLVDVIYVHYPAEMSIYKGLVEDLLEYAETGATVAVPTTTSTLACDLEQWDRLGCPAPVHDLQAKAVAAHRKMGMACTYTCTPQFLGYVPPKGSYIISVESSAIIYFNSVLGARTNRGGHLTRYSAITGKYPLIGYLLDENRRGTHLIRVKLAPEELRHDCDYSALGFAVGRIVGSQVPIFDFLGTPTQTSLLALGAALATSGSVALFHAPPHTAEAKTVDEAFQGAKPVEVHEITKSSIDAAFQAMTTIAPGDEIDFVTLGCPHYNLEQIRYVAEFFRSTGEKVNPGVRLWICTNRMTKQAAAWEGYTRIIEDAGGFVVCDTCPVESHMRISTCREHGLSVPQIRAMVTDSFKMARYVRDLIGCETAIRDRDSCLKAAISGRMS
ncbi:aconitase X catalytic domain-containing protein [bacterium]|nr:aconitase X catalytic domain-containing protein [bacterium]